MAKPPVTPIDKISAANRKSAKAAHESAKQIELELVSFKTGDKSLHLTLMSRAIPCGQPSSKLPICTKKDRRTVGEHIQNIISEGELDAETVCRKFRHTGSDGKTYEILHYDLDMILAVGFRVKSPKASQFRKWAYQTLRGYIVEGYALNEFAAPR